MVLLAGWERRAKCGSARYILKSGLLPNSLPLIDEPRFAHPTMSSTTQGWSEEFAVLLTVLSFQISHFPTRRLGTSCPYHPGVQGPYFKDSFVYDAGTDSYVFVA